MVAVAVKLFWSTYVGPYDFHDAENRDRITQFDNKNYSINSLFTNGEVNIAGCF